MKKIKIINIAILFALLIIALAITLPNTFAYDSAVEDGQYIADNQQIETPNYDPQHTADLANVWVIVTENGTPLRNRRIEGTFRNYDGQTTTNHFITNENGVIHTIQQQGTRAIITDIQTNKTIHFIVQNNTNQFNELQNIKHLEVLDQTTDLVDSGVWIVVAENNNFLANRSVQVKKIIAGQPEEEPFVDRIVTDEFGVAHTRLERYRRYEFLDLATSKNIHIPVLENVVVSSIFISETNGFQETTDAGIWLVVTENGLPATNRRIQGSYGAPIDSEPKIFVTNNEGVIYTRLKTNSRYKFYDVATENALYLVVDKHPQVAHFQLTKAETQENLVGVKINVKSQSTNQPISFADVQVYNQNGTLVHRNRTDQDGFLLVDGLPVGDYDFVVRSTNYEIESIKRFKLRENTYLDVFMSSFGDDFISGHFEINFAECAENKLRSHIPREQITTSEKQVYSQICSAQGHMDLRDETYYMSINEAYRFDFKTSNIGFVGVSDTKQINTTLLVTDGTNVCLKKQINSKITPDSVVYGGGVITESDLREIASNCNTTKRLNVALTLEDYPHIKLENKSRIKYISVFSDYKPTTSREVQRVENLVVTRDSHERPQIVGVTIDPSVDRYDPTKEEVVITQPTTERKLRDIKEIIEEQNIMADRIISDIKIEQQEDKIEYVFEILEQRKLFGIIPFGDRITEKRVAATMEIYERG